jgi:hypothetical protein
MEYPDGSTEESTNHEYSHREIMAERETFLHLGAMLSHVSAKRKPFQKKTPGNAENSHIKAEYLAWGQGVYG